MGSVFSYVPVRETALRHPVIAALLGLLIWTGCERSQELTIKGTVWGFDDSGVFLRAAARAEADASYRTGFKVVGALPGSDDIAGARAAVRCAFPQPVLDYLRTLGEGRDIVMRATIRNSPSGTWQPGLKYALFEARNCTLLKVQSGGLLSGGWIDPPIEMRASAE
jgi:hypothetical protein